MIKNKFVRNKKTNVAVTNIKTSYSLNIITSSKHEER